MVNIRFFLERVEFFITDIIRNLKIFKVKDSFRKVIITLLAVTSNFYNQCGMGMNSGNSFDQ